jgi:hypothetical protein
MGVKGGRIVLLLVLPTSALALGRDLGNVENTNV